jgi:purine-binding chemotaxis protein CheW
MESSSGAEPHILFDLAGTTYALRSRDIQQLEMVGAITPVPNAPPFVAGVVSIRGQVIPVVDLRARFGFAPAAHDLRSRLIVTRSGTRTIGLLVDSAREFAAIPAADVQPPPDAVAGLSGRYLEGIAHVGERLVLLLNVAELIDPETSAAAAPAGAASVA